MRQNASLFIARALYGKECVPVHVTSAHRVGTGSSPLDEAGLIESRVGLKSRLGQSCWALVGSANAPIELQVRAARVADHRKGTLLV